MPNILNANYASDGWCSCKCVRSQRKYVYCRFDLYFKDTGTRPRGLTVMILSISAIAYTQPHRFGVIVLPRYTGKVLSLHVHHEKSIQHSSLSAAQNETWKLDKL